MSPLQQKARSRSQGTRQGPETLSLAWLHGDGLCGLAGLAQEGAGWARGHLKGFDERIPVVHSNPGRCMSPFLGHSGPLCDWQLQKTK